MMRDRADEIIAWVATLLLCVAAVDRLYDRGGPYLQLPRTVLEHAGPEPHALLDALRVVPLAESMMPHGAEVAVIRMEGGEARDDGSYLTAVGLLPHHVVLPPFATGAGVAPANLPDFVVALGEPFEHAHYRVVAGFPRGWLYQVNR